MTVHASKELVGAMRGVAPQIAYDRGASEVQACSGRRGDVVWSHAGINGTIEGKGVVDCPDCLRLMRAATDPVRYDFLRERGLVPELPLVSG